ncbi:hypothetical protein C8T65DRAFT_748004 [Cerioporus squamosus]|nr:hypothetical protein C8T65DRAFT_748004 [Cerioporus squamosus]
MRILDDSTPRNPALDSQVEAEYGLPSDEHVQYGISLMDRRPLAWNTNIGQQRTFFPVGARSDLLQEDSCTPSPEPAPRSSPLGDTAPPLVGALCSSAPPVPSSPLTNRGACMSVAHIVTPSLVPTHRVA